MTDATNPTSHFFLSFVAGHYVPAISHRIYEGNQEAKDGTASLPLSGFAIGNGLTNPAEQYPWYPEMVWNNSHHIQVVSEDVYEAMKGVVPHCTSLIEKCNSGDGMINTFACQSAFVLCNMGLTYVCGRQGRVYRIVVAPELTWSDPPLLPLLCPTAAPPTRPPG